MYMIGAYTNKCIFKFSLIKPLKNAKIHTCNHANASSENTFPPQHLYHSLELAWVSDLKIDQNTTTTTNTEPTKRRYADAYDFSTKYNHTLAAFSRPQVISRRAAHRAKSFFFVGKSRTNENHIATLAHFTLQSLTRYPPCMKQT